LLREVRRLGGSVDAEGQHLAVEAPLGALPDSLWAALTDRKQELLRLLAHESEQVAERVAAFEQLVHSDLTVPFLALPGAPTEPGHCLSCGADGPLEGGVRCELCVRAAQVVVERVSARRSERAEAP
jgi:hypothetical protein